MGTDWSKVIERYLGGELSSEGIEAFEFELSLNPDLRSELDLHRMIRESVFRSAERLAIQNIAAKYHFRLKLKKWLMFTSVVITITTAIALIAANDSNTKAPTRNDQHLLSETSSDHQLTASDPVDQPSSDEVDSHSEPVMGTTPTRTRIPRRKRTAEIESNYQETVLPGISNVSPVKNVPDNTVNTKFSEPKPEPVKVKEKKKQRLILGKGLLNPLEVKEAGTDSPVPSGAHWTLGNFMIYASDEGITFHNFLTDDVIIVGRTPKDQLKPPSKISREGVKEEELKKDKGTIYLQNY